MIVNDMSFDELEKHPEFDYFVKGLREIVTEIEARPETSRYHYADYNKLLLTVPIVRRRAGLAFCLVKAGANRSGVRIALKLATGGGIRLSKI